MRVLLVNEAFYPDQAATATYLTEVALELVREGHSVSVLTGRRGYLEKSTSYPRTEGWNGIQIHRVRSVLEGASGRLGRVLYSIGLSISFCVRYLFLGPFDAVLLLSAPPLVGCFFPAVVNVKRTKLLQWLMDINPEQGVRAGWLRRASVVGRILGWLQRRYLRKSHKIFVLDTFMCDLLTRFGIAAGKIEVLPLWGNQSGISVTDASGEPAIHCDPEAVVIMYAGNHSLCHPLATLLEAAKALRDEEKYQFYFVGGGPRVSEVKQFKELHRISNIHCHDYVSREQLAATLNLATLHVVSMGEEYVGVVHPSKIYPLFELEKPFILLGPRASAIGTMLVEAGLDWQVDHGDLERLLLLIRQTDWNRESYLPALRRLKSQHQLSNSVGILHKHLAGDS